MPLSTSNSFDLKNLRWIFSFIFISLSLSIFAQGNFCNMAEEFCPANNGDDVTFPAGVNNGSAEPGNNYGCLGSTPNPAWYYIQVGQGGNITIQLTNSNNEDIDFALWGPFPDLNVASDNCGSLPSPTDCSYSGQANETVMIPNSSPGQIYILLITNFSNDPTDIFGEATGTGVPACCQTPLNTGLTCPESASFSCGCWTGGIIGTLPDTNPAPAPNGFCGTTENQQWIDFESCWCAVSVEITAEGCPNSLGIEAQLFSECDPFTPISNCVEIPDGTSAFLTGLSSGTSQIDCEIGGTYTLLLDGIDGDICSYIITATEVPILPPIFEESTIPGPDVVCFGDTITFPFPMVTGATFCDATFSAPDADILEVTHEGVTVAFGETSGELCITASNCAGTTEICKFITVEECCFSVPGDLLADDFVLCEDVPVQVTHTGNFSVEPEDISTFVLHDGVGSPIGNIIEENTTGIFNFQAPMFTGQTYFIDFVTGRMNDDGTINYDHICLDFAENRNTVIFFPNTPPLEIGEITKVCDDLAAFYTIAFEISNGIPPYDVNGEIIDSEFYVSPPIPAGDSYSFEITSVNFCLAPLVISGQEECPCATYAGMIEDEFTELCGDDVVQILQTEPAILDDNDVLVYVLRNGQNEILLENTTGSFTFQDGVNYNEQYSICIYTGNDDGTGSPLTDYACFSQSNCKDIVFYEDIEIILPDSIGITCDVPMPPVNSIISGGSGNYTASWIFDGLAFSEEEDLVVSEPGIYTLTVFDTQTDCETTASVEVYVVSVITGVEVEQIDPTCFEDNDGSILIRDVVGGIEPYLYQLNDEPFTGNTEVIALPAGDYELTVVDVNGCEFKVDAPLNQPTEVIVDLGNDLEIELGDEITISAESSIDETEGRVTWTINEIQQLDTLFSFDSLFLESVLISALVEDANGCFSRDLVRINVEQKDPIFVPNAFSPNDDGRNDILHVFGDRSVDRIDYFRIYDRWGNLVYTTIESFLPNDTSVGWDGLHKGKVLNGDVFVYSLQATYIDGRMEKFTGDVTLIR